MSRILFLDLDGVLNSRKYMLKIGSNAWDDPANQMDPLAVQRLNTITKQANAVIVLSSTWRYAFNNQLDKCQESMRSYGIEAEVIGMTPNPQMIAGSTLYQAHSRTDEIKAWLNSNKTPYSFVIIDDEWMSDYSDRHVKTYFEAGLQDYHIKDAINILNRKL